jgi:hypothetical protein
VVRRNAHRSNLIWFGAALFVGVGLWDWLPAVAIAVLWLGWRVLVKDQESYALGLAFAYQWVQATAGLFYYGVTGRVSPEIQNLNVRPFVVVALGALLALLLGLTVGKAWLNRRSARQRHTLRLPFTTRQMVFAYALIAAIHGPVTMFAWRIPQLTQLILALSYFRYAILFLVLRRLLEPQPRWFEFASLAIVETALNFTGYFADFKQPLAITLLVLLQDGSRERVSARGARPRTVFARQLSLALVGALSVSSVLVWTAVKFDYRAELRRSTLTTKAEKFEFIFKHANAWINEGPSLWVRTADRLVDRAWQVHYPALVLRRVPAVLPHTNGTLIGDALLRLVTPRLFFPEKAGIVNSSELVRTYAGVRVSGAEKGTSFALGYVAESYIDFGYAWMFVPIVLYGVLVGSIVAWLSRKLYHRDLAVGCVTLFSWLALHVFEASWAYALGQTATLAIVLGSATVLLDRLVHRSEQRRMRPAFQRYMPQAAG